MDRRGFFGLTGLAALAAAPAGAASVRAKSLHSAPRLFVRDWGEGRPVLFVHGWALASEMWSYVMQPLSDQGFRCIAYDRRGHGRSGDAGNGYDYDTLAGDLAGVMAERDLRDVVLVGHSMAAGELVRILRHREARRIAKLVFVAPAATPFLLKTADNPRGVDAAFFAQARAQMAADFPAWIDANEAPFVLPETSPGMRRWIKAMMEAASLKALIECNKAMTTTDFRAELRAIDRPALVIHGTRDASAPLEMTGRPTAALIPGAELKVYEGAPHGLFATHAPQLAADIAAFARG
ncbi:alpha/beta fold hydrolase [Allosphingosinicella indica]|uniref:Pimeloyl-ACP methyl ester carboxylesterase n=1 Tax=Allosphingosinicella indica TaxID=941907 RepID=A0A1X7G5Z1_9SPHN|nr:alpha/beta hydrolase [Allosphingosinicella indica]SMF64613.1 Pimeloyl-ACP methyl ester carboxylesterase [Allosphingosinicella indica]